MAIQEQAQTSDTQPAANHPSEEKRVSLGDIGRYIAVGIIVLIALFPLYWTFATSVKSNLELNAAPPTLIPQSFSFENYIKNVTSPFFIADLEHSAIIAVVTTVISLLIGTLCAYAIARMTFRGKPAVLLTVLAVNMVPFIALVGPIYVLFTGPLNIYDTYPGLIIPDLLLTLPLTVWFLTSFFRDLPADLEEAARVDGASRLRALWSIILPLTAPGLFATAILSFIAVWNDFLFGLILSTADGVEPVTVGVTRFNSEHAVAYGQLASAAIIVTIPLVILVLIFQRRIVSGLTAGAVKG